MYVNITLKKWHTVARFILAHQNLEIKQFSVQLAA